MKLLAHVLSLAIVAASYAVVAVGGYAIGWLLGAPWVGLKFALLAFGARHAWNIYQGWRDDRFVKNALAGGVK